MASTSASGPQAKRRAATYGKTTNKKAPTLGLVSIRTRDPPVSASAKLLDLSPSGDSDPESGPSRRGAQPRNKGEQAEQPARPANRARAQSASHSQPLPGTAEENNVWDIDGAEVQTKKRKLARTFSERQEKTAVPYSTPESSPLGLRPSPSSTTEFKSKSPPSKRISSSSDSTPKEDVAMKDATLRKKAQTTSVTTKTSRFLTQPRTSNDRVKRQPKTPVCLSRDNPSRPNGITKLKQLPPKPKLIPSSSVPATPQPRRARLIDALAAQATEEKREDSPESETSSEDDDGAARMSPPARRRPERSPAPAVTPQQKPKVVRPISSAKKPGPKFTYSQQRTMLAEQDPLFGTAGLDSIVEEPSKAPLFDFTSFSKPSSASKFAFLDEDDETINTGAVRSIHELRQAGANSRFEDEMADIMDRIGSPSAQPSSLRRGGLLELADKMREKDFRRQFRNHGSDGSLFERLGEETDIIAGYAIVAIAVVLLASSSAPHLVHQLGSQGIASLLARLLAETADIAVISKDRKRNVSKNGQATLSTIKSAIMNLAVWHPVSPESLSPRTLALKCLDLIIRQSVESADEEAMFPVSVTDLLFSLLSAATNDPKHWDLPSQPESHDCYLVLSVLEGHSVTAMQSEQAAMWSSQYGPVVAGVLETVLRRPADKFGELEGLTLRLTLNLTNHNPLTPGMFVDRGLLRELATAVCRTFSLVIASIKNKEFPLSTLQSLIAMLCVMINFCEHYPPAAQNLDEMEDRSESSPLSRLIRMFLDNEAQSSDDDSMEKTHLNVAFGYLSILLGYLCLRRSIRERFESIHSVKTLEPLLKSIRNFITFHQLAAKTVEGRIDMTAADRETVYLESLFDRLEKGS